MTIQISWLPRPAGRRPWRPEGPGHEQKEKTMIFHINRATYKAGLSEEQRRAGVEMLRQSGAVNPAVKSYVVGPELGGEFEYGAVYVFEDLDGSDSDDPEFGEKIAALQARHLQEQPELAALVAQAASFTVPDRTGQPAAAGGQAEA